MVNTALMDSMVEMEAVATQALIQAGMAAEGKTVHVDKTPRPVLMACQLRMQS